MIMIGKCSNNDCKKTHSLDKRMTLYKKQSFAKAKKLLWEDLYAATQYEGMFGCSALGGTEAVITNDDGVPAGIISGHAYSIINVIQIEGELLDEIKAYNPFPKETEDGEVEEDLYTAK